jgi:pyrimidine-nucleoside phosphorylase
MNKKLIAVVTAMDQPLGNEIGNRLEVKEAVQTLQGHGPDDLTDVCLTLGSYMLTLHGKYTNLDEARRILSRHLTDGTAYAKFLEFVRAQGGDQHTVTSIAETQAPYQMNFTARRSGYITAVKAMETGKASMFLGAGRETKEDTIDMLAGITLLKKYGDYVKEGDTLAILHTSNDQLFSKAAEELYKAFEFSEIKPDNQPLIIKVFL